MHPQAIARPEPMQEDNEKRSALGNLRATPYNNRFNLSQRGRHALCSGRPMRVGLTAKVAPEPPSVRPFQAGQKGATASQVNRALCGQ